MIVDGATDIQGNGEWSDVVSWPIIPLHSIVLPDGNVLSFGSTEQGMQGGQFVYDLWDPVTNVHRTLPNTTATNIFCSNMAIDPATGNVVIMGGDNNGTPGGGALSGIQDVVIFDYEKQEIRDAKEGDPAYDLATGRYYGTVLTLPNGEIMMIGGRDKNYQASTIPEIYNPATGVRELTGAEIPNLAANPDGSSLTSIDGNYWYPHAYVTSTGDVIVIEADGDKIYRIDTDGVGSVEEIGTLPFNSYTLNSSIMFATDKIMIMADDGGLWVGDLSGDTPQFTREAQLDSARTNAGLIPLPDGTIAIVGGGSAIDQGNVLADAEKDVIIWDPETNSVTYQEDAALARLYHSSALILPDGTVLSGGGGAPGPLTNLNAEVFMPNYLFDENGNLAERPEITDAPANVATGATFTITVDNTSDIDMVSMTRSGAMTHARNSDVRFEKLNFTIIDGTTIEVTLPQDGVALPGLWMLNVVDTAGVPSVASLIGVDMAPLVDTPDLVASTPIYNIDDEQIDGPFTITVEAQFTDIDAGGYQRVFDFGNGEASDNIWLGQVGTSSDMKFEIWKDGVAYGIVAANAIVEGEIASWEVSVDPDGTMHLSKNGTELVQGPGVVPADVERTLNFVGASNWANDAYLRGMVRNLEIVNDIGATDGNDTITGTDGNDTIDPLAGDDVVDAGGGNDTLLESEGNDTLDGGDGNDTLKIVGSAVEAANWTIDLESGVGTSDSGETNSYANIENVIGGSGDDRISGNDADNELSGGDGDDVLIGRGGNNILDGGVGDDRAEFAGNLADYTLDIVGPHDMSGSAAATFKLTGTDGKTTIIKNIETVTFTGEEKSYTAGELAALVEGGEGPVDYPDIDGAFTAEATVRFDDIDGGSWQRVFDFGNGPESDNVWLGQVGDTDTMRFEIWKDGTAYMVEAAGAIVEGETATFKVTVDTDGKMSLYKGGALIAEGPGVVPADVDRANEFVGKSNWEGDTPLIGAVTDFSLTDGVEGGGEGPVDYPDIDGAFTAEATVRFDDIDGGSWQRVFDFGNGPESDNVWLGQVGDTDTMRFEIWKDGTAYKVEAAGAIVEGETATFKVTVDTDGKMSLYKGGALIAEGPGVVPADVDRANEFVGKSNWEGDTPLIGEVTDFSLTDGVEGGGGNPGEVFVSEPEGSLLEGTDGDDTFIGSDNIDVFVGGKGDDDYDGKGDNDTVKLRGRDTEYTFTLNDDGSVTASHPTEGTDTLKDIEIVVFYDEGYERMYSLGELVKSGIDGDDTVTGTAEDDILHGGKGNDTIDGGDGNDIIFGGDGDDVANGGLGDDQIRDYGTGNDVFRGGDGDDSLASGEGNDELYGEGGNDFLVGGSGDDILDGGEGDDSLYSGDGNDILRASLGTDTFDGQDGVDTFDIGNSEVKDRAYEVDLEAGTDQYGNTYANIENVIGGDGDDIISGTDGDNVLSGGGGNDRLVARGGNDTLDGGDGEDRAELEGSIGDYTVTIGDDDAVRLENADGATKVLSGIEYVYFATEEAEYTIDAVKDLAEGGGEGPVDYPDIDGAFTAEATVRFDDIDGGSWQRVFDFGNGPESDNVWLGQVGDTDTMRFEIWKDGTAYMVEAAGAIVEGETATFKVTVDTDGKMSLYKGGALIAEGPGVVPADVDRANEFVGKSNWEGDTPLIGAVTDFSLTDGVEGGGGEGGGEGGGTDGIVVDAGNGGGYFTGTDDNDTFNGGDGKDVFYGGAGNDVYDGAGGGYNQVDLNGSSADYTFTRNDDGSVTAEGPDGTDTLRNIDGLWFYGEQKWYDINDLATGDPGNGGGNGGGGNGGGEGIVVDAGNGGGYFTGTDGDDTFNGGSGKDVFNGGAGDDLYDGAGGAYNQVDFSGSSADYTFTRNDDGSVTAEGPDGTDTLKNIDGLWFNGEQKWYDIDDLATGDTGNGGGNGGGGNGGGGNGGGEGIVVDAGNGGGYFTGTDGDDTFNGGNGKDVFNGGAGDDLYDGAGGAYNQVDFSGSSADYTFTRNDDGSVTTVGPDGTDTLKNIDGLWFNGEQKWYDIDDLATGDPGNGGGNGGGGNGGGTGGGEGIVVDAGNRGGYFTGTDGNDTFNGGNGKDVFYGGAGDDIYDGAGGAYNQVDLDGSLDDYTFTRNDDGSVTVAGAEGTDVLQNIDGIWSYADQTWSSLDDLVG